MAAEAEQAILTAKVMVLDRILRDVLSNFFLRLPDPMSALHRYAESEVRALEQIADEDGRSLATTEMQLFFDRVQTAIKKHLES